MQKQACADFRERYVGAEERYWGINPGLGVATKKDVVSDREVK